MPTRVPAESPTPAEPIPRAVRIALVVVLVASVVYVNPWTFDPFVMPKDAVIQLGVLACLVAAVLRRPRLVIPVSPLSIPLGLLVLVVGLSAAYSALLVFGFLQVVHLALLVVFLHLLLDQDPDALVASVFRTMAVVGGLAGLFGLLQLVGLDPVWTDRPGEPYSFLGNRNFAAEFLILVVPPTLAMVLLARTWPAVAGWSAVAVLLVVHLAATQTRAALFGLTLGVLVASAYLWRARTRGRPLADTRRWILVLAILAAGYAIFLVPPRAFRPLEPTRALLTAAPPPGAAAAGVSGQPGEREKTFFGPQSLKLRLLLWQAALRLIGDHWWRGVGPMNVDLVFGGRYVPVEYWWPEWVAESFVHNEVLQIASEVGLPGLALALWAAAALTRLVWRARLTTPRAGCQVAAGVGSLAAILGAGLFGFPLHLPAHRLYTVVLVACLVVLTARPTTVVTVSRPWALAGVAVFAVFVAAGPIALQVSEVHLRAGMAALDRGDRRRAAEAAQRAVTWFPSRQRRDELFRGMAEAQYERAVRYFHARIERDANDHAARLALADALLRAGRAAEAAAVIGKVLAAWPSDPAVLRQAITIALDRRRPSEALGLYEHLAARTGCDGLILFNLGVAHYLVDERATAGALWRRAADCAPELRGAPEAWLRRFGR